MTIQKASIFLLGAALLGSNAMAQETFSESSNTQSASLVFAKTVLPAANNIELAEHGTEASNMASNSILSGLIDLPRHEKTGPVDGCSKVNKGHVMGGGFMMFTCEKLLPYYPIRDHRAAFNDYQIKFKNKGWSAAKSDEPAPNKKSFKRMDDFGCETTVDMELWTDRSMNETMMDNSLRNNHRQIVFKAWFRGDKCEVHYETAELLTQR